MSTDSRYPVLMVRGYLGFDLQSFKITMVLLNCHLIINQRTPVYMLNFPMEMQSVSVLSPATIIVFFIIDIWK